MPVRKGSLVHGVIDLVNLDYPFTYLTDVLLHSVNRWKGGVGGSHGFLGSYDGFVTADVCFAGVLDAGGGGIGSTFLRFKSWWKY